MERDEILEAAIDRAGRDKVFAIMRAAGWSGFDRPPKFVWEEAIRVANSIESFNHTCNLSVKGWFSDGR